MKFSLKDEEISEAYNKLYEAVERKQQLASQRIAKKSAVWHVKQALFYMKRAGEELSIQDLIDMEGK